MPYRTPSPPAETPVPHTSMHPGTILVVISLMATMVYCVAPSQRNPSTYGTVRVALADAPDGSWGWSQHQRDLLDPYINLTLDALGPDFVLIQSLGDADVLVRASDSTGDACGLYRRGESEVFVNSQCAQGDDALRRAVGHELVHYLTDHRYGWLGHLCTWPINDPPPPGCHPTILCQDCLMSPGLRQIDLAGASFDEAYVPPIADPAPAAEDLQLISHCQDAGQCQ